MKALITPVQLHLAVEAGVTIPAGSVVHFTNTGFTFELFEDITPEWYRENDCDKFTTVRVGCLTTAYEENYKPGETYHPELRGLFYDLEVFPAQAARDKLQIVADQVLQNVIDHGLGDKKLLEEATFDKYLVMSYIQGFMDASNPNVRWDLKELVSTMFHTVSPKARIKIVQTVLDWEQRIRIQQQQYAIAA